MFGDRSSSIVESWTGACPGEEAAMMIESTELHTVRGATYRDATPEDAEFLAWVMLTATRSHLPRGIWDFTVGRYEIVIIDLLPKPNVREPEHLFHHARFPISEVDERPPAPVPGSHPVAHSSA